MDLNGVVGHVVQGTKVLLECTVRAARPAANITWQNGTEVLNESNDRLQMHETKVEENVSTNLLNLLNVCCCKIALFFIPPFVNDATCLRYACVQINK